jgi:hypothetical protein
VQSHDGFSITSVFWAPGYADYGLACTHLSNGETPKTFLRTEPWAYRSTIRKEYDAASWYSPLGTGCFEQQEVIALLEDSFRRATSERCPVGPRSTRPRGSAQNACDCAGPVMAIEGRIGQRGNRFWRLWTLFLDFHGFSILWRRTFTQIFVNP